MTKYDRKLTIRIDEKTQAELSELALLSQRKESDAARWAIREMARQLIIQSDVCTCLKDLGYTPLKNSAGKCCICKRSRR